MKGTVNKHKDLEKDIWSAGLLVKRLLGAEDRIYDFEYQGC